MSANLKFKSTPVRERVSKEEWQMRVDLAAAYQLAVDLQVDRPHLHALLGARFRAPRSS